MRSRSKLKASRVEASSVESASALVIADSAAANWPASMLPMISTTLERVVSSAMAGAVEAIAQAQRIANPALIRSDAKLERFGMV